MLGQHSFLKRDLFMFLSALSACASSCRMRATHPIIDGCEMPSGCWELNPGSLRKKLALLTAEPSLQHPRTAF